MLHAREARVYRRNPSFLNDKKVLEIFGAVVGYVLSYVDTMSGAAEDMRHHGNVIRNNVENLLVSLQFQDRISQILDVVINDIDKLRQPVEQTGQEDLSHTDQWLEDLQASYTMQEEFKSRGGATVAVNTEMTFF